MNDFVEIERRGRELDASGMRDLVAALPEHVADASRRGARFADAIRPADVAGVVVCGMGGSAIGGDMARSYLGKRLRVPLHVNRGYEVPPALERNAFVVFSSYSGNTGETLAAYEQLRGRSAPSVAITSGGELAERCRRDGLPVCEIPGGMPPRAAIAYSLFPLLRLLVAAGVASMEATEIDEARSVVANLAGRYSRSGDDNLASVLAYRLRDRFPFVYSAGGVLDAVARRWSSQFNENAKTLAHFGTYPELNHNEIVGWKAVEAVRSRIVVIALEDPDDHPDTRRQGEIAQEIVEAHAAGFVRVGGFEGGRLARMLSAMILGDFTSVYLAYLNGEDPTPVENIDILKERLKK